MPTRNPAELANLVREPWQQLEFLPIKGVANIERSFQCVDRWQARQTQPLLLTVKQDSSVPNQTAISQTIVAIHPCSQPPLDGVGRV